MLNELRNFFTATAVPLHVPRYTSAVTPLPIRVSVPKSADAASMDLGGAVTEGGGTELPTRTTNVGAGRFEILTKSPFTRRGRSPAAPPTR